MAHQRIFVVGGSGFLGSAIVKQAVARGWEVVSISPSGRPFTTPAGHRPGWSTSPLIRWQSADALRPETYADELRSCTAVVHTIGILLESDYKGGRSRTAGGAQESGAGGGLLQGLLKGWGFGSGNPLNESAGKLSYEVMNRDSALSVARAFIESRTGTCPLTSTPTSTSAPFVYISAEDIFRPIVSERYIKTKREAEYELARLALDSLNASSSSSSTSLSSLATAAAKEPVIRPFYVRPGLMYHPQTRPLSTFPAALLDLSASIHARLEPASSTSVPGNDDPLSSQRQSSSASRLPFGLRIPTPASLIRSLGPEGVQPLADLLTLPPLHIDTVAKAVCAAIAGEAQEQRIGLSVTAQVEAREAPISVGEVLATSDIRRLAGWKS
ncbi:unnamed protein product [Tilletia controversa]|uniref:NAD-dependent epimerase/dehydratase domain-containing protein n=1 Tax=Tilletia controversa TaxID=13291 RepID=A0A8X7MTM3_9BASI|nr:hypothetical protein A4X06_0g4490 [Tilletia controversa]CAD6929223.1 unnamed protein product [Tilletia controversa]